jgi:hypothetical protein
MNGADFRTIGAIFFGRLMGTPQKPWLGHTRQENVTRVMRVLT